MLLPLVGHPMPSTQARSGQGQVQGHDVGAATGLGGTPSPGGETLDIAEAVASQMEQDLDYQILRKAFNLEDGTVADARESGGRVRDSGARLEVVAGAGSDLAENGLDGTAFQAADFSLEATWSQSSASRLELSVSSRDGRLALQSERFESQTLELDLSLEAGSGVQLGDPLVLDLGGQGVQTTGVDAGVLFDLDADGRLDRTSTVTGDSWLLALDANDNGRIDDGRELFGDQQGAANGFEELAKHDSNQDGRIDANDAVYAQLRLLQIQPDGEQVTQGLSEAKVVSIELGYQNTRKALELYDQVAQTSRFVREDGTEGEAVDVLLGHKRPA